MIIYKAILKYGRFHIQTLALKFSNIAINLFCLKESNFILIPLILNSISLKKQPPIGGEDGEHSEETLKKLSFAKSGTNHPLYGKPITENTRKKSW